MPRPKKSLKELQAVWDQKLKDSGFVDIEDGSGNLKEHRSPLIYLEEEETFPEESEDDTGYFHSQPKTGRVEEGYSSLVWKQSVAEYYRLAGQFSHEYSFKSDRDRVVWQLHCEGKSSSEVASIMKLDPRTIKRLITSYALAMKEAKGL